MLPKKESPSLQEQVQTTLSAIEMSKYAESIGVDGLLVVTPYYNKCTQEGLIEHYKKIAGSVTLPIILYSVKSRTGVNIEPETCLELSKIPNIVAIKEASRRPITSRKNCQFMQK